MRPAITVAFLLVLHTACSRNNPEERAMLARDSLKSIHFSDDFHVELVASEPNVMSPVEMAFDEDGKMYVAEIMDYPQRSRSRKACPFAHPPARGHRWRRQNRPNHGFRRQRAGRQRIHAVEGGLIVTSAPDIL
jgi:hypothetical protein